MPLYDYECETCKTITEYLLKHEDPAPLCPTCQATLVKVLSKLANYTGAATAFVNYHLDRYGPDGSQFKE